jgi:hypothetical protein
MSAVRSSEQDQQRMEERNEGTLGFEGEKNLPSPSRVFNDKSTNERTNFRAFRR